MTYRGLPGLLADSLPDKFGNALFDAWLATRGRAPESFNAVERLCYIGRQGMGALEFEPSIGPKARKAMRIQVDQLVELASEILAHRNRLKASFAARSRKGALNGFEYWLLKFDGVAGNRDKEQEEPKG